jgi:hypothetical protein
MDCVKAAIFSNMIMVWLDYLSPVLRICTIQVPNLHKIAKDMQIMHLKMHKFLKLANFSCWVSEKVIFHFSDTIRCHDAKHLSPFSF